MNTNSVDRLDWRLCKINEMVDLELNVLVYMSIERYIVRNTHFIHEAKEQLWQR